MAEPREGAAAPARDAAPPVEGARAGGNATSTPSGLRREILLRLRRDGPASPDQLARSLAASRTGVLQQLRALEAANLVRHDTQRHGVGRPRHVYEITEDAQGLFPANYDGLAADLLAAIGAIGGDDLVEQIFVARRRQIGDRVRRVLRERLGDRAALADRVRELAVVQDEQGYLADATALPGGRFRLREFNCAIHQVARGARAACEAELDLFREVLGVDVVRETHIMAGDRCCSYLIAEDAR